MDAKERIIRKLLVEHHCHRCGCSYDPDSILMLARRSEVWMLMVSCSLCKQKDTFVFKFPVQMQGRRRVTSYRLSRPPSSIPRPEATEPPQEQSQPLPEVPITPVTSDDVLDMHQFLKRFNGDFRQLFAEVE